MLTRYDIDDTNCYNATNMTNISTFDASKEYTKIATNNNDSSGEDTLENNDLSLVDNEEKLKPKDTVDSINSKPAYPDQSWNETANSKKQIFAFDNTTLNCTQFDASEMDNSMQSTKNEIDFDVQSSLAAADRSGKVESEIEQEINEINEKNDLNNETAEQENTLYSTAKSQTNSMIIRGTERDDMLSKDEDDSTLVSIKLDSTITEDDLVEYKNCLVSFATSTRSLYIQFSDFDVKIEEIQPAIDDSVKPYDTELKPKLCVALWEQDGLCYRCRINDWNEDTNEAYVYFVDFGNTERVMINNVTAMSESLTKVQPLCVFSKLKDDIPIGSESFRNFEQLVANEVRVNVVFKREELSRYLATSLALGEDVEPLTIKLLTADQGLEVCAATLEENNLWRYNLGSAEKEEDKEKVNNGVLEYRIGLGLE